MTISNLHPVLTGCLEVLTVDPKRRFVLCRDNDAATWFAVDLDNQEDLIKFYNTQGSVAVAHIKLKTCLALVNSPQFEVFEINLTSQVQFHAPDPRRMDLRQYLAPGDNGRPTRQVSDTQEMFPDKPTAPKPKGGPKK